MNGATAALGKRVYRGGSFAPTRGAVSGKGVNGYIQRENRNQMRKAAGSQVGQDGESDTRSTQAAKALKRKKNLQGPNPADIPMPESKEELLAHANSNFGGTDPNADPTAAPPSTPAAETPTYVNSDGTLNLPYSTDWASGVIQSQQDLNSQILEAQMGQQQSNLAYQQLVQDAASNYSMQNAAQRGGYGGAGTVYSSLYKNQVANDALTYDKTKAGNLMDFTNEQQGYQNDITSAQSNWISQMQQLALERQTDADSTPDVGANATVKKNTRKNSHVPIRKNNGKKRKK